ncbi:DUF1800 domain-containing protein [Yoonia sp. 2307UL14-13]|uniref:DUF1800 domain-containing protein n=1 Tax=Yoonia sp. 2307UL14-13 TaxID=3126506 RepID=UPI0030A866F5
MQITRRELHKGLLSLLVLSGTKLAAATPSPDIAALNRLTYGATPEGRDRFVALGLRGWLDAELAKPANDPAVQGMLDTAELHIKFDAGENDQGATWEAVDEMRPLSALKAEPADLVPLLDFEQPYAWPERIRPAKEVVAASLIRAVHADAQLREVMTGFWHEHFSVNALTNAKTAVFFPAYDRAIRAQAFGNFRTLLGEVTRAPSMLRYLNNDESRASPANENFARELLELHTLGIGAYYNDLYDNWRDVPGALDGRAEGYIDQDVYEVARAFTGWSIGDGRWVSEGVNAPETGKFHYIEAWHDPYQKRVLGVEFQPNRGPMADGEQVLDMLAAHPATARHVTRKLLIRLGIEAPSDDYHDAVTQSFRDHAAADDQIAHVLRTAILHPEFSATQPAKLRRPFEYLAAIYRASGAQVISPSTDFDWHLTRAGWTQHQVKPPTGHSDLTVDWANTRTLNGMVGLALYAHEDWMNAQERDSGSLGDFGSLNALIAHVETRFGAVTGTVRKALATLEVNGLPEDREDRVWVTGVANAAAALQPQFMLR